MFHRIYISTDHFQCPKKQKRANGKADKQQKQKLETNWCYVFGKQYRK